MVQKSVQCAKKLMSDEYRQFVTV